MKNKKDISDKSSKTSRRIAGGAATGGGMNFQADVTAIAYVYMARGQQLSWLENVVDDLPVAVDAETGGAGDDIRLLLKSGEIVEVQVKKGLKAGEPLWNSLLALASALKSNAIGYGVLVVSPTSSNTITEHLTKDIVRLGDGRTDNLSDIAIKFVEKLKAKGLPIKESCNRIRIQTINTVTGNSADIKAARSELSFLCADQTQIKAAWNSLYKDASVLIEQRGRRDVSSVLRILLNEGVKLTEQNSTAPMLLLEKLANWSFKTHATFSIFGIKKALRTDEAWIPLRAVVRDMSASKIENLADALKIYQSWGDRSIDRDAKIVDPETLARFVTRAILVGGPGMGKSTLLKRITRRYSEDHIPVLNIRLSAIASRMQGGSSFEEAVFELGLDGCDITPAEARTAAFPNWLLLCDGLDECGKLQESVAAGIDRFAVGHPDCRVLVTTRPVGYDTAYFSDWRHYDLAPLEPSSAPAHLTLLVSQSAPAGSELLTDTHTLCSAELKSEETAKVVARSPLLLGLAASIIVRGGRLGDTKERLYEQIFELVDEAPNSRTPEPPVAPALLRRYLDILAWQITENPLSRINHTIDRCAEEILRETASKPLQAQVDADACLHYWQDVGMVERIGHGCDETLSFIHKSFGEFAAARYLRSMPYGEQRSTITNIVDVPEWQEVIRFAALLGVADSIGEILSSRETTGARGVKHIALALETVATGTPPPKPEIREAIISKAFSVVSSERREHAFEVGEPLVAAARRFPDELGPLARKYIDHKHEWASLVAWSVAMAAGEKYYPRDQLADALSSNVEIVGSGVRSSLAGGFNIGGSYGLNLLQSFVLNAASVLLEEPPTDKIDDIVRDALNNPGLGSMKFLRKAQKVVHSKGRSWEVGKSYSKSIQSLMASSSMNSPDAYHAAQLIALDAIFDTLELPVLSTEDDKNPGFLLHFSAFLKASNFWEMPASDTWAWTHRFDHEATQETIKGFINLSGIDNQALKSDALRAKTYLHFGSATESGRIFDITTDVDPPKVNWTLAPTLDLDVSKIESALFHPSQWIIWLAANLIENLLPPSELKLLVRRVFASGERDTLWAASGIAAELEKEQALELLFERLSKPLVRGCEYLYKLLQTFELQWETELSGIIRNGLNGHIDAAIEAAKLASSLAKPGQTELESIIDEALLYWVENEEPYPTQGGSVPKSPRSVLLDGLLNIRPPDYTELRSYAADPRSDVRDTATGKLIEILQLPDGPRVEFLNDIQTGELSPHLLRKALDTMAPLNPEEQEIGKSLLVSSNPKIRFNAMSLLHKNFLSLTDIRVNAQKMLGDGEQEIRDRAYRIIDTLQ